MPPRCHVAVVSRELWHSHLGHAAPTVVTTLHKLSAIQCNKAACRLCHACQLGKHARLPFASSVSSTLAPFELVHCDVWTSPVPSISGFKFYLVLVDDYTHYCWTYLLCHKSEVHDHLVQFVAYAHTQFSCHVRCFQADNGTELINNATTTFMAHRGIMLRTSCPYTSAQNGKAERMLRTLNNVVRTLLIHAAMPASYWVEALSTTVFLINRRPSSAIHIGIPYHLLYRKMPDYSTLRVFGCLCYPNLSVTTPHKLSPRSTACVLLGRRVIGALISPPARSSPLAMLCSMRLTSRLRLPSHDRILLIFCYRTLFRHLLQMLRQRMPLLRLPHMRLTTTPAIPSGWTLPSCGMVPPTGCPRHHAAYTSSCCYSCRSRATSVRHPLQSSTPSGTSSPAADADTTGSSAGPSTAASISGRRASRAGDTFHHRLSSTAHVAVWLLDDNLQPGLSASRHHSCCTCRCPLPHSYGRRV
jgi:transposase InsO family protein